MLVLQDSAFKWVSLAQLDNALEANLLKGWLEQHHIQVRLQGEQLAGAIGEIGFQETTISLFVYEIKLHFAKRILLEYQQQQSLGNDWQCHHCGEINASSFELCWSCTTEKHEETK